MELEKKEKIRMKKILTIILLVGAIILLVWQQQKNTLENKEVDFSVKDISQLEKIYFADRYGNEVTLNKTLENWLVNNKYSIRKGALETLFSTLERMRVKHPVSKSMHNSVIKTLASEGVKVELYTQNKQLHKTFYVGGETSDFKGTYMIIEGAKNAFVMHIPGWDGFLTPRFNIDGRKVDTDLWRSRKIFENSKIDSINLNYHENPIKSFTLDLINCNIIFGNKKRKKIDSKSCSEYLKNLQEFNCEGYANDFNKKDSLILSPAFHTITIFYNNSKKDILKTYHKKPKRKEYKDTEGNPLKYDVDRLYAFDGQDILLIQYYAFNPIIKPMFTVEK